MNNILEQFNKDKNKLVELFDKLGTSEFIPCKIDNKEFTKEDIKGLKNNLINEHFIISVCGQVKAGKSTFLNYLLFNGEDILPTDPTPCTAKLSKISYSEEEYIEVYFYTSEEWHKLKNLIVTEDDTEVNYYDRYLKEFVDESAMNGVYDKEFIKEERQSVKVNKLKGIKDYVSKEGVYTPFVSHLDIYVENELIKNATIVDTPGINDSNELRSRVTEEWISQSNAILMLMYAGQALTKVDLDFIDRHLSTVPSEKIIFALSKADAIEGGIHGAKEFVKRNLINNPSLKERKLLENKDVYPISTIAAIIDYKNNNEIALTEDEEFYKESIDEEIIEKQGYLPELYKAIEKHIMLDKGAAIISSAKSQIKGICKARIDGLKIETEVAYHTKGHLLQGHDEIKLQKERINSLRKLIKDENIKYSNELGNVVCGKLNEASKKQNDFKAKNAREFEKWLSEKKIDEIIKGTMYEVKRMLEKNIPIYLESILDYSFKTSIDNLITDFISSFKQKAQNIIPARLDYIFYPAFDIFKIVEEIKAESTKKLSKEHLSKLKERVWGFLWTNNTNTKANVANSVNDSLERLNEMLYRKIGDHLGKIQNQIINKISENMEKYLKKLDNELEKIDENFADDNIKMEEVNNKIKANEELIRKLEKEFEYFKRVVE